MDEKETPLDIIWRKLATIELEVDEIRELIDAMQEPEDADR